MIRTLNAFTAEIDDADLAFAELSAQLDMKSNLLHNTVGIVTCYSDFIDSGLIRALSERLPFDIVGCTTCCNAVNGDVSSLLLCLTVYTSDDVTFATAVSAPLSSTSDIAGPLADAYRKAASALPGRPSLIMTFAPLIFDIAGDRIVAALDEVSGGLPNFGTTAVDHTRDYHTSRTIHNQESYRDCLALILFCGEVTPKFTVASISQDKIYHQSAIITASDKNIILGVNNMSVLEYLGTIGLVHEGRVDGIGSIPFMLNFNAGEQHVARAIFALTPEGYAVSGGEAPVDAILGVGAIDVDEVLRTAEKLADTAIAAQTAGALLFSCIARNTVLGPDTLLELECVRDRIGDTMRFMMSYSGGEICPVYNQDGTMVNRYHNYTNVMCSL